MQYSSPPIKYHELAAGIGVTTVGQPGLCNHGLLLDTLSSRINAWAHKPETRYSNFVFDLHYSDRSTSDQHWIPRVFRRSQFLFCICFHATYAHLSYYKFLGNHENKDERQSTSIECGDKTTRNASSRHCIIPWSKWATFKGIVSQVLVNFIVVSGISQCWYAKSVLRSKRERRKGWIKGTHVQPKKVKFVQRDYGVQ